MADLYYTTDEFQPTQFLLGGYPAETRVVTIPTGAGNNFVAGSVMGSFSATPNEMVLSDASANDGTEEPEAVLAEAVDATSEDKQAVVYIAGEFDEDKLTYGPSHDADTVRPVFRLKSMFLRKPVKQDGEHIDW